MFLSYSNKIVLQIFYIYLLKEFQLWVRQGIIMRACSPTKNASGFFFLN